MKSVPELMALSPEEASVYIDSLSDKEKIALREASIDWLIDELKFTIMHGTRRVKE